MFNILLIEDNKGIQELNKNLLETVGGYNVRLAMNLAEARQSINESSPDVIVLDIMLPDGSGLDFLGELRRGNNETPVLLLTALGETSDKVEGLNLGGDDYLAKPYDYDEFLARLGSLTRRVRHDTLTYGAITINQIEKKVRVNGKIIQLTQTEYGLLLLFVRNENKTMSAESLYKDTSNQPMNDNANALQAQISRLRKKLRGSGYSITVKRERGYVFETE